MSTKEQRDEWRAKRRCGMTSAVGEYTPSEFWELLDEVERLERDLARVKLALPEERSADGIPMPKEWIEAAKCPNCGGVGWRAIQVEAGVFEQEQCQWCFEQWLALGQPSLKPQHGK